MPQDNVNHVEIVGVKYLNKYRSCMRCKARVEPCNAVLGRCSKEDCTMLQKYTACLEHITAKVLFKSAADVVSLYAHGQTVRGLEQMDESLEVTEEVLLAAPILAKVICN